MRTVKQLSKREKSFQKIGIMTKKIVDEGEAYLDPAFKLTDLALRIGVNRTYVSRYFNLGLHVNFIDYINGKRIDRATEVMRNSPDLPADMVCKQSGFISAASFYRNFKRFTGLTPLGYIKSIPKPPEENPQEILEGNPEENPEC